MSWIIVKKDGSLAGTTSDLISEAAHFLSRGEALLAAMSWIGSRAVEVRDVDVLHYEHEPLRTRDCFANHICDPVEDKW